MKKYFIAALTSLMGISLVTHTRAELGDEYLKAATAAKHVLLGKSGRLSKKAERELIDAKTNLVIGSEPQCWELKNGREISDRHGVLPIPARVCLAGC